MNLDFKNKLLYIHFLDSKIFQNFINLFLESNRLNQKIQEIINQLNWVHHFEFLNVEFGFLISDPKNTRVPNFFPIK